MSMWALFFDIVDERLVRSAVNGSGWDVPALDQYETLDITFTALRRVKLIGEGIFERVNLDGLALEINVGIAGTAYATQNSWTPAGDNLSLSGLLNLNTGPFNGLTDGTTIWLEVILSTSTSRHSGRFQTSIRKAIRPQGGEVQVPGDTALGELKAAQLYLPRKGLAGQSHTLVSPNGTKSGKIYWGDDGKFHAESIT